MDLLKGWEGLLEAHLVSGAGRKEVERLLRADDQSACYSLCFNAVTLYKSAADVASLVMAAILLSPKETLEQCHRILLDACAKVFEEEKCRGGMSFKQRVRFRVTRLPDDSEFALRSAPRGAHAGRIVSVRGTVIKATVPKVLEKSKILTCIKCGHEFEAEADYEQFFRLEKPSACPGSSGCSGTVFTVVDDTETLATDRCSDWQEVKIQEQVHRVHTMHSQSKISFEAVLFSLGKSSKRRFDPKEHLGDVGRRSGQRLQARGRRSSDRSRTTSMARARKVGLKSAPFCKCTYFVRIP